MTNTNIISMIFGKRGRSFQSLGNFVHSSVQRQKMLSISLSIRGIENNETQEPAQNCFIVGHIMPATPSPGNTSATNRTKSAKSKKNKKNERNVLEEPFMKNAIYTCHNIQG